MAYIFSDNIIEAVWNKAKIVPGYNSSEWRQDIAGAWIKRSEYGNRGARWGWEIDHIKPVSKYGSDNLDNLQPLQWENNASKKDNYPMWVALVSSCDEYYKRTYRNIVS